MYSQTDARRRRERGGRRNTRAEGKNEYVYGCAFVRACAQIGARCKREQKAAGVLERSVKCLNKRAIILTRSGISGVFQPSKVSPSRFLSLSLFLPSFLFAAPSSRLHRSSSFFLRSVCLFSSCFRAPAEDVSSAPGSA